MKVLFAFISACHKSRREHVITQRNRMRAWEHWGVKFDWQIIFGAPETQDKADLWLPQGIGIDDHIMLAECDDRRQWMTLKNQAIFNYALSHGYDFVLRACDDSVVYPHRFLAHQIAFDHDYIGTMCGYGKIAGLEEGDGTFVLHYMDYMHGGVGIGLSRRAMELLVADKYPGPSFSPYPKENYIDIIPGQQIPGGWGTYWDDLWIGEVLKGHIPYHSKERFNTYFNYKVEVYDNPRLFASNKPYDTRLVIATHSEKQMGSTELHPSPFSTIYSKAARVEIPIEHISSKFKINSPDGEELNARNST